MNRKLIKKLAMIFIIASVMVFVPFVHEVRAHGHGHRHTPVRNHPTTTRRERLPQVSPQRAERPEFIVGEMMYEAEIAVLYVHHGVQLVADGAGVVFTVLDGELPAGLTIRPNGELYGIPLSVGEYTFTVRAALSERPSRFANRTFTMYVHLNTDENVALATSPGHEVLLPQGESVDGRYVVEVYMTPGGEVVYVSDDFLISAGIPEDFVELAVNGMVLETDSDYYIEPYSTVITIRAQTFARLNLDGEAKNTISAQFRDSGDVGDDERLGSPLKRTAQNFYIVLRQADR